MKNKLKVGILMVSLLPIAVLAQTGLNKGAEKPPKDVEVGIENSQVKLESQGVVQGLLKENNATSTDRRSAVSNAVREMLQMADRQGGIGQRVREIANKHEKDSNDIEDGLKEIKNRGQFRKFLFGPNYKKIGDVEGMLKRHTERTEELKQLLSQVTNEADKSLLSQRITEMESIKAELEKEVNDEQKGFSLFGWLNKLINKK